MKKKKFTISQDNLHYKYHTKTAADAIRAWAKKHLVKGTRTTKPDRQGFFKVHCPATRTNKKVRMVARIVERKKAKPVKKPTTPIPTCEAWCAAEPQRLVVAWSPGGKPRLWARLRDARRVAFQLAIRYGGKYCHWAEWSKKNPRYGIQVLALPEEI